MPLYAAEQAIATNASAISSLRDSVASLLTVDVVNATVPSNENSVSVTAPTKSGYRFVCWVGAASDGWLGNIYFSNYGAQTTNAWTNKVANYGGAVRIEPGDLSIRCYALYSKSI